MLHRSKEEFEIIDELEFVVKKEFTSPKQVIVENEIAGCGMVIFENPHNYIVACGYTGANGYQYCDDCSRIVKAKYPQGYSHYPGDICKHGTYTGGCGADHICGQCEEGN